MNPFTLLDSKARKTVYVVYGSVALLAACIDVGYAAANVADPTWLTVSQSVLAYLAAPVGVLAASNTPASTAEVVDAVEEQVSQREADRLDEDLLMEEEDPTYVDDESEGFDFQSDPNGRQS